MREELFGKPLYWFSSLVVWCGLKLKYRFKYEGRENVPSKGGVILAANHCSYLDPPVLACSINNRLVHFMARETLLSNPVARWYFPRIGMIPLDREHADVAAMKKAISLLKEGKAIALFPEGTRSPDGELHAAKGGIGFLMTRGKAPVVPMHIGGTYEAFPKGASRLRPGRITVKIGKPISVEELAASMMSKKDFESPGRLVMERIAALGGRALPPAPSRAAIEGATEESTREGGDAAKEGKE
jgi:1-acyl-sn-glycerol-3-phosphate acyltransferase